MNTSSVLICRKDLNNKTVSVAGNGIRKAGWQQCIEGTDGLKLVGTYQVKRN
jgi:hypothetical protein